jgi:hypothetical protein
MHHVYCQIVINNEYIFHPPTQRMSRKLLCCMRASGHHQIDGNNIAGKKCDSGKTNSDSAAWYFSCRNPINAKHFSHADKLNSASSNRYTVSAKQQA